MTNPLKSTNDNMFYVSEPINVIARVKPNLVSIYQPGFCGNLVNQFDPCQNMRLFCSTEASWMASEVGQVCVTK